MIDPTLISRLTDEHADIRLLVAELSTFLDAKAAPSDPGFATCRWALLRRLSVHLAHERRVMAGMLRDDATRRLATCLDVPLEESLRAHMAEWTGTEIERRWPVYRAATRALLHRLCQRMAHEEGMIFPRLVRTAAGAG